MNTQSRISYRATQPAFERPILLRDDQGHPLLIDAELDQFFTGSHTYKKTIYNRDGALWVDDYGMHNALAGYQHKPRLLGVFVWESWHANPIPRGYTVRLREYDPMRPPKYCISNLILEKIQKQESA